MWKYAHEHHIPERVAECNLQNVAIQGEFCGAGIQKNRLKLTKPEWYVFTVIDLKTHRRYPIHEMRELCAKLQLKMVPVEEEGEAFAYGSVDALLERAKGKYPSGMSWMGAGFRPIFLDGGGRHTPLSYEKRRSDHSAGKLYLADAWCRGMQKAIKNCLPVQKGGVVQT